MADHGRQPQPGVMRDPADRIAVPDRLAPPHRSPSSRNLESSAGGAGAASAPPAQANTPAPSIGLRAHPRAPLRRQRAARGEAAARASGQLYHPPERGPRGRRIAAFTKVARK
jgi:hypothetical protein